MLDRRNAVQIKSGAARGAKGAGGWFHSLRQGLCGEGAPNVWSRLAIGMPQVCRLVEATDHASVSLRRIASVFEVFGRSILSWRHANRKSVAGRERCRSGAVEIQGTEWWGDRTSCGRLPRQSWERLAGTCGDRASIGRAWLRTSPESIGRSGRQFLAAGSQRG